MDRRVGVLLRMNACILSSPMDTGGKAAEAWNLLSPPYDKVNNAHNSTSILQ
jgi:hypothetical protein